MMRLIDIVLFFLFAPPPVEQLPAPAKGPGPDLSGVYVLVGTEGDGDQYEGLVILRRQGNSYVVQWAVTGNDGEQAYDRVTMGRGVLHDKRLSVAASGAVFVYRVNDDGSLSGEGVPPGGGEPRRTETLTFWHKLPRRG